MAKNTTLDTQNFPPINTNNINTKNKKAYLSNSNKRNYSDQYINTLYANPSMKISLNPS